MLITLSLGIMTLLSFLSIIIGNNFISTITNITVNNTAIINGTATTYIVPVESILFAIDTSTLVGAIAIISFTLIAIAGITGVQVLGSGLNAESSKIIIIATVYVGIWFLLSVIAFPLIVSIEIFGSLIYIGFTIIYVVGVMQKISGVGG